MLRDARENFGRKTVLDGIKTKNQKLYYKFHAIENTLKYLGFLIQSTNASKSLQTS